MLGCLLLLSAGYSCGKSSDWKSAPVAVTSPLYLADPTIFHYRDTFYLYGTDDVNADRGFTVYTSTDLNTWRGPRGAKKGLALTKGDAYGSSGFWAPQVFRYANHFYMAYVANEHIAIAEADSPLGPFSQRVSEPVTSAVKTIDPFVFENQGKMYLYCVELMGGNRIYMAELNGDLTKLTDNTLVPCINGVRDPQAWENIAHASSTVTEGPTVLKHKGYYYLFYSANDFRSPDYAVGYATSPTPEGPWIKYAGNPILSRAITGKNGSGHGDFFSDDQDNWCYVFHTHNSETLVSPRKTALITGSFQADPAGGPDRMVFDRTSFHYLNSTSVSKN